MSKLRRRLDATDAVCFCYKTPIIKLINLHLLTRACTHTERDVKSISLARVENILPEKIVANFTHRKSKLFGTTAPSAQARSRQKNELRIYLK